MKARRNWSALAPSSAVVALSIAGAPKAQAPSNHSAEKAQRLFQITQWVSEAWKFLSSMTYRGILRDCALVAILAAFPLSGSGAVEPHVEIGVKFISTVTSLIDGYDKLNVAAFGDPELQELSLRIGSLEVDVKELERFTVNITHEVRRQAALQLTRDLDQTRALVQAALFYALMPHYGHEAEVDALAAAIALKSHSFYTFAGTTPSSPDRFDPRAAVPSYLEAVTAWIAIRKLNGSPFDEPTREKLGGFADRLTEIANNVRRSISCAGGCQDYWKYPVGWCKTPFLSSTPLLSYDEIPQDSCPPILTCGCQASAWDAMSQTGATISPLTDHPPQDCPASWDEPDYEIALENDNYAADLLEQMAALWSAEAGR